MTGRESGVRRAQDPRPAKTRAAIIDAANRLAWTQEAELSVAMIAKEAGISRTSFYAQFKDLDDIAVQLIRERFVEISQIDDELRSAQAGGPATLATTSVLLDEFLARRHLFSVVLGAVGSARVSGEAYRTIQGILAAGARQTMLRVAPAGIDPDSAATFIAAGILAVIVDWLAADEAEASIGTREELQDQIIALLPTWVTNTQPPSTTP
ncbi:TetR/AcrR family transcriptional regulator [Brevibacterium sp. 50QC2O2]|uniref:TetR/AcrR family transcriptional regulator n=1 Tax=Brevibacterium TaxID=1696 RepID=UPI00211BB631|nr:TetR/AcrR family transcriptional regulator [Brevibacterium sp. 91QC2O2]MCQ9386869.1 TetR/AcrR family transcriptional regulator [Brevibacterium sp. 68QC2CO]MCQ9389840.1 TetR/AcrR family transcriptional regulator [Brevibacterium sp. 50QC2O2]